MTRGVCVGKARLMPACGFPREAGQNPGTARAVSLLLQGQWLDASIQRHQRRWAAVIIPDFPDDSEPGFLYLGCV